MPVGKLGYLSMKHLALSLVIGLVSTASCAQPAVCQKGVQELQAKRHAESIEPLTQCLKLDLPAGARALVLQARAQSYREMRRWSAAVEDQRQSILAARPTDVWPYVMLGAYLREEGKLEAALEALQLARQFDEDGPGTGPGMAVYYHTAKTLHQAGRYGEAVEAMTQGIPKQPDYGAAFYQRALSYEAMGDRALAKQDLSRAAALVPKDGYVPEMASKLREYGFIVKVFKE